MVAPLSDDSNNVFFPMPPVIMTSLAPGVLVTPGLNLCPAVLASLSHPE